MLHCTKALVEVLSNAPLVQWVQKRPAASQAPLLRLKDAIARRGNICVADISVFLLTRVCLQRTSLASRTCFSSPAPRARPLLTQASAAAPLVKRLATMDIEKEIFADAEDALPEEFQHMSADAINQRVRLLDNEIKVLNDDSKRLGLQQSEMKEKIKENKDKIKLNNQLPYLVGNIVEVRFAVISALIIFLLIYFLSFFNVSKIQHAPARCQCDAPMRRKFTCIVAG